jgi:uncharacterized membrane protein (DUF485 family)
MEQSIVDKVKKDPAYIELTKKRDSFAIMLSIAMLVIYFAFILVIAFNKELLATPLSSDSVTTLGIPVGIGVILSAFVLTGIYVKRANSEFDDLIHKIKSNVKGN